MPIGRDNYCPHYSAGIKSDASEKPTTTPSRANAMTWTLIVHNNGTITATLHASDGRQIGTANYYVDWRDCFDWLQPPAHIHIHIAAAKEPR